MRKSNACPWSVRKGTTCDGSSVSPGWHSSFVALNSLIISELLYTLGSKSCPKLPPLDLLHTFVLAIPIDFVLKYCCGIRYLCVRCRFNMISSKYIVIKQRGGNMKESYSILLKQILHFERKTKDLVFSLLGHLSQHNYSTCAKKSYAWKSWKA